MQNVKRKALLGFLGLVVMSNVACTGVKSNSEETVVESTYESNMNLSDETSVFQESTYEFTTQESEDVLQTETVLETESVSDETENVQVMTQETNKVLMGTELAYLGGMFEADNGDKLHFNWFTDPDNPYQGDISGTLNGQQFRYFVPVSETNRYSLEDYNTQAPVSLFITGDADGENTIIRLYDGDTLLQTYIMTEVFIS